MTDTLIVVQPSLDYAHRVLNSIPNAVFVADKHRAKALKTCPHVIVVDLADAEQTHQKVLKWAKKNNATLAGITTFICEAMYETAALAQALNLPFHAEALVERTRNKYKSSTAWQRESVPTPATKKVHELNDLLELLAVNC